MSDPIADAAHAFLRSHTTGELRFDEHLRPIRYVVAGDGRLVAPAMVAMLESRDTVLFVPECVDGAMEVQVTLEPLDERGPDGGLTDRWRIYHGTPEDVRWAWLDIDAVRHDSSIVDGAALTRPNPLAGDEAALCRWLNREHADDLRALCGRFARITVEEAVLVGVDPLGLDVRGTFVVHRVPSPEPMPTADDARRVVEAMIRDTKAGHAPA
ncbi:MAG: DUF2470 domain-containing protein [Planctomycetota bacterium]|jgi:hypothetical protein